MPDVIVNERVEPPYKMKLQIVNPLKKREYKVVTIRKRSEVKCIDDVKKVIID